VCVFVCVCDLQCSQQLAAVLNPGDVEQLVNGSMGQLGSLFCVHLDRVQDLILVLGAGDLQTHSEYSQSTGTSVCVRECVCVCVCV